MIRRCAFAIVLLVGCAGAPPPPLARTEPAPSVPVPEPVVAVQTPSQPPCVSAGECTVIERHDAGRDESGAVLVVWETSGGARSVETGERVVESQDAESEGDEREYVETCELHAYWLEREGSYEVILSVCNDGYGAAGVGEDDVIVRDNFFEHIQSGGSNWRWSTTRVHQLSPRRLLRTEDEGEWTQGTNTESRTFDFEAFRGTVSWSCPPCGDDEDEGEADDPEDVGPTRSALVLPTVSLDGSFDPASIDLRACATHVDGTDGHGFVLSGAPLAADDASMDVLVDDAGGLVVVARDDAFVHGDRIELHRTSERPGYMHHCVAPSTDVTTVVIDALTGAVVSGRALSVRHGETLDHGRFIALSLPAEEASRGITIAYRDVDPHEAHAAVLATSDLVPHDAWSLGTRSSIEPGVRCEVSGGALVRTIVDPVQLAFADGR